MPVTVMAVCWLKPGWFGTGNWIGSTRMPSPPRITVFLPNIRGVHANPRRGLKMELLVLYTLRLLALAKVSPPSALNWLAGTCGCGASA